MSLACSEADISPEFYILMSFLNFYSPSTQFKFYKIQKDCPVKNDWVLQVQRDREEIDLGLTDSDFTTMSKWQFKKTLKKKVYAAAIKHLNNIAEDHSKSYPLIKSELKCEAYITDSRFKVHEVQLLFSLRSRSYPVKANLKNKYKNDLLCGFCRSAFCEQQHLLQCSVLKKFVPELRDTKVKYDDIFSDSVEAQLEAVKLFNIIDKQREILCDVMKLK